MNKKVLLGIIILSLSFNLTSCSLFKETPTDTNVVENPVKEDETPKEDEPIKITDFEALNKVYTSTKDMSLINIGDDIYDDRKGISHIAGEYKEMDFIKDLLYLYLNEDQSVFSVLVSIDTNTEKGYIPITNEDKEKLIKDLNSLREQMELNPGEEMVVRLDKVTYEGPNSKTNTGSSFKIRAAVSRVGATVVPWNYFTVTVFEDGNKLYAHLF
ncbi:MAG: hypothetical protein KIC47_03305 [Clostridium sp.]|nr:hypothetical protein [Clostridium sp.]